MTKRVQIGESAGFSVLELLLVIAVIVLLAALLVASLATELRTYENAAKAGASLWRIQ